MGTALPRDFPENTNISKHVTQERGLWQYSIYMTRGWFRYPIQLYPPVDHFLHPPTPKRALNCDIPLYHRIYLRQCSTDLITAVPLKNAEWVGVRTLEP